MSGEMRFEWDPRKAASNRRKHRISFELAKQVFWDPLVIQFIEGMEHGEIRWRAIGEAYGALLFVSYATFEEEDGTEIVRIISARKASRQERRAYERSAKAER
jgi:uncharacterized protein